MSSQRPAALGEDWRRAEASPERRASGPKWRRGAEVRSPRRVRRTRALKIAFATLSLGILGGLLIWVSTWLWPPQPASLVLVGAGYEQNLAIPHNVYGQRSLRILADQALPAEARAGWGSGRLRLHAGPLTYSSDIAWDDGLAQFRGSTLVLFLALHGGSDRAGPYLLTNDADAQPTAKSRLRLSKVIDRLAQLPAHLNKVLILDATQIQSHWTLGMIQNDFARGLAELEPRIVAIPHLVVLSASDVDQRSWSCDALGQTIFASSLIAGLQGAAAGEDGRIDAEDLYQYVERSVRRWVGINLQERQTPVLFPAGAEGRRRARDIELCGAAGLVAPSGSGSGSGRESVASESDALPDAWREYQRLRTSVPAPFIRRPHEWQRYKATLLRYDELVHAGALDKAGELAQALDRLVHELDRPVSLGLSSAQGSLPMGTVEGRVTPASEGLRQPFEKLWEAGPADEAKLWQQLQASPPVAPGGAGGTLDDLRRGLLDLLILRAADDPGRQLERAVRLAKVLVDPGAPPPIEIQELIMLARDLPRDDAASPALFERVTQAIRARRLAERAVLVPADRGAPPYGDLVLPWVRTRMDEADSLRRQGIDLLFASDASSWDRAGDLLQRAEQIYGQVQHDATQVLAALATRDEVLEALPDYTRWLGQIRPDSLPGRDNHLESLQANVEQLWDSIHILVATLDQGDPQSIRRASGSDGSANDLVSLTASIRERYQEVAATFRNRVRAIEESDLASLWSPIRIALSVPFDDLRTRERLSASLGRIERRFMDVGTETGKAEPATSDLIPEATNQARALQRGRIQGLLALETQGERWFETCVGGNGDRFAQVRGGLERLADDPSWRATLSHLGDQVGDCTLRRPITIDRLMTEGLTAADPKDRTSIGTADRLWRQLDGTLSVTTSTIPSEAYRRIMVRDLLLWQASRTLGDHWYSEDPALDPYYRTAGLRFVDDARRLDPRPMPLRSAAKEAQAALERPGRFGFGGPERVVLTSERQVEVEYRLQPDPGLAAATGFPVVWAEPGRDLVSLAPQAGRRMAQPLGSRPEAPILCTFTSPRLSKAEDAPPSSPQVEHSTCGVHGLFRGQQFSMETTLDLHLLPEQVVGRHPVPPGASVSVRAQDAVLDQLGSSSGAIAIVLDCSGSMGPAAGQSWGPSTKYKEATQALRQVLAGLSKGTVVSVWVFGQAIGFEKTVKDAERTITRVQEPIAWDPGDPGQLKRLMDRLEYPALEPWNESPIVRAMLSARDDLRNVAGFKTLLVLTDGMDNRYERDSLWNPRKTPIPVALRDAFDNAEIEVNIVGYKVVGQEAQRARDQFRVIEKLPIPGKFYEVNDAPELAGVLGKAMGRRLRYWVEQENNVLASGTPSEGLTTSRVGANDRWFVPALGPGGYKLVIDPLRRQERHFSLNNGDLLIVQLDPARSGVDFRRIEYAREDFSWRPSVEKQGWRLAVLQDQVVGDSGLQLLCTLERAFSRHETSLSVVRPREVWFELSPWGEPNAPIALRWSNRTGYPAAAWTLDVSHWPTSPGTSSPARPNLRVWWNPDQDFPAAGGVDRGVDFELNAGRAASPVPIEGDDVIVESVRIEDHRVETRSGVREVQSCLVVRLSHAKGKSIAVRPTGLAPAGSEHRFYTAAAKTTALFWPVTRDEAREKLAGLSLFSLDAFKAQAERRGFALEMRDLPTPRADDFPPQEVPIRDVGISVMPLE